MASASSQVPVTAGSLPGVFRRRSFCLLTTGSQPLTEMQAFQIYTPADEISNNTNGLLFCLLP